MRTGRTGFKFVFHLGIRKLVDADFSIVPQDAAAQAERAEAQQQQRFVGKFDGDPVGGDAPFARVTRGGVETARHRHQVVVPDCGGIDLLQRRHPVAEERELMNSIEIQQRPGRIMRISGG